VLTVDAILWDLDGTLIDPKKDIALSVQHIQKKYGFAPSSDDEIARFIGDGVVMLVERALQGGPAGQLAEAVDAFKRYYREHALDTTTAYPGVVETLAHFRRKKMGVVTNKPERVSRRILDGLDLGRYFSVVIGGDTLPRKKPEPDGVLRAMDLLGVCRPGSVLMVGDGHQDIAAGRAAGTLTCGIFSNIGDPEMLLSAKPDFTVSSLSELMRIVD
jgi:2-phosphoglycolate phosphatase